MPKPKHYNPDGRDAQGRLYPTLRGMTTCPQCGRDDILVNSSGTLRYHYPTPQHPQPNCPGSGMRLFGRPTLREAQAALERIRALHKMMLSEPGGPAYCTEDSARWPCPTIRALEEQQ
jgi:hypothetical protein